MWLRNERTGFRFRRQHPIGPYVLDFYCAEAKLCVEVDGEQHLRTVDRDQNRDEYLSDAGTQTYRFPSLELFEPTDTNILEILNDIQRVCSDRSGRSPFPRD